MVTKTASPERLLTAEETAEMLGIKTQTLAVWRTCGRYKLPFHKVGRCVRYKLDDVVKWLDGNAGTSTGEVAGRMDDD